MAKLGKKQWRPFVTNQNPGFPNVADALNYIIILPQLSWSSGHFKSHNEFISHFSRKITGYGFLFLNHTFSIFHLLKYNHTGMRQRFTCPFGRRLFIVCFCMGRCLCTHLFIWRLFQSALWTLAFPFPPLAFPGCPKPDTFCLKSLVSKQAFVPLLDFEEQKYRWLNSTLHSNIWIYKPPQVVSLGNDRHSKIVFKISKN